MREHDRWTSPSASGEPQVSSTHARQVRREATAAAIPWLMRFPRRCPMTSNFPFCQLVVLDRRHLPLNFPRPAADGPLADTFMQPGNLPKWSPKRPGRQTSLSRVTAPRQAKRANRTLRRAKIDNTDSSWQVSDARRGIFDVTGQQVRIGPCDLGARHKAMTRPSDVVPGRGQGTAAADEASRGKMAQTKWQRCHRPAQRSCQAI